MKSLYFDELTLDDVVQYRKNSGLRILLRLPVEERRVLEAILPTKQQKSCDTRDPFSSRDLCQRRAGLE